MQPAAAMPSAMIVSASYRTDIPAFYGDWFMRRLDAGFCRAVNPWGGPPARIDLTPDAVDGFVFWTRNMRPFLDRFAAVAARFPAVVQYTITGYPRALEASTVAPAQAVADMRRLRADFGPRVAVWRYDPVLLSDLTPPDWHRANFRALAADLAGSTDEAVISFAHAYRKTMRNLDAAAARHGFAWTDPEDSVKRDLAAELAAIAAEHGMRLTVCAQAAYTGDGAEAARCIDADRLSDVAGRPIAARTKGNRADCLCGQSRDIGAYESCPHGCVYCYAVASPAAAKRRHALHDPAGEFLIPPVTRPVPAAGP